MSDILDQMRQDLGAQSAAVPASDLLAQMKADVSTPVPVNHAGMSHLTSSNPNPPTFQNMMGNLGAGAIKGASQIGSTLLIPADMASKALGYDPNRRAQVTAGLQSAGADPTSTPYQVGQLGAEVAGTAGIGGAMGDTAPVLGRVPGLLNSIKSGGFSTGDTGGGLLGNLLTRSAGGATLGGASAGLVDPSTAPQGAMVGAAIPVGAKVLGSAGGLLNKAVGKGLSGALGVTTGTGEPAINAAFQAGKVGDTSLLDNMRGDVPMTNVLDDVKAGLAKMRADKGAAYRNGMAQVSGDKTVLDFQPIQDAMNSVSQSGSYKGQQINKNASGVVQDLNDQISNWANLDPAQYHTPEGLDALKQSIGDIRDSTQFGTPARRSADTVYNSVKNQIVQQAPTYADTMSGYAEASDQIKEIERALSAGNKAAADTTMRKLQSVLRNNVSTNYGNRNDLVNQLQDQGGVSIVPQLAGQSLNSWSPRGMIGQLEKGGGVLAAMMHPASLAAAPLASPRLMGEAAYGAGRLFGNGQTYMNGLLNAGKNLGQQSGLLGYMPSAQTMNALKTVAPSLMFSQ